MAEVSLRIIENGIYRLTVFRTKTNRPLCTEGTSGSLAMNCASCHNPAKEDHVQVLSKNRAGLISEKLSKLREVENQQRNVTFLGATSFYLPSSRFICCADTTARLQAFRRGLLISTGLLQEKLLPSGRSPWTKGLVFIHSDAFRSPQRLRTFCTALFVLTDIGSETCGLRHSPSLRGSTTTRGYSRRSKEAHQLHRSKTTFYDILKVSPSATQSQIKTAYYKLSFIYHPDKNAGSKEATQRFSKINEAYTVLGNVSLRRSYDQGLLNQTDIQSAARPSTQGPTSRFTGYQRPQKQQQRGRPIFDFDTYYKAHYGEQLERERLMRARKKQMEEMQKKSKSRWKQERLMELTFIMLVSIAGLVFISLGKP